MGLFSVNYNRPGPGVGKDEPQKKRFFQFWSMYFDFFWNIMKLNFLFLLFSIPIVTAGASFAAMTYVMKNYVERLPVFVFSDFLDAFKQNWKQGVPAGLVQMLSLAAVYVGFQFYWANRGVTQAYYLGLIIIFLFAVISIFMYDYIYLLIVSVKLKLSDIFKNAFILSAAGFKTNLYTLLATYGFLVLVAIVGYFFMPVMQTETGELVRLSNMAIIILPIFFLLIGFATMTFISVFNSHQYVKRYLIDPARKQEAGEAGGDQE